MINILNLRTLSKGETISDVIFINKIVKCALLTDKNNDKKSSVVLHETNERNCSRINRMDNRVNSCHTSMEILL